MLTINYDSINDIWVLTYLFVICLKGTKVIRRFFFLNNYLHNDDKKNIAVRNNNTYFQRLRDLRSENVPNCADSGRIDGRDFTFVCRNLPNQR